MKKRMTSFTLLARSYTSCTIFRNRWEQYRQQTGKWFQPKWILSNRTCTSKETAIRCCTPDRGSISTLIRFLLCSHCFIQTKSYRAALFAYWINLLNSIPALLSKYVPMSLLSKESLETVLWTVWLLPFQARSYSPITKLSYCKMSWLCHVD